jgi:hypothetical protein
MRSRTQSSRRGTDCTRFLLDTVKRLSVEVHFGSIRIRIPFQFP